MLTYTQFDSEVLPVVFEIKYSHSNSRRQSLVKRNGTYVLITVYLPSRYTKH